MIIGGIIIIGLFILGGIILAGKNISFAFNLFNFLFVLLPPFFVIIFSGYSRVFLKSLKVIFLNDNSLSINMLKVGAQIFDYLYKSTLVCGLIGTLLGLILHFDKTEVIKSQSGQGLYIALFSLIYGLSLSFFLYYPMKLKLLIRPGKRKK